MKRPTRWLRRLLLAAVLLTAVGILIYWLILPAVVRWRVASQLDEAGLAGPSMTVRSATPHSLRLTGLRTFDPRARDGVRGPAAGLQIDDLHASYDLSSLAGGKLRIVELRGAEWTIVTDESGVDLGLPQPGKRQSRDLSVLGELPFDALDVRSSRIVLVTPGRIYRFPLTGTVRQRDGRLEIALSVEAFDQTIALNTSVRSEGKRLTARLEGEMPAAVQPGETRPALTFGAMTATAPSFKLTGRYDTHADQRLKVRLRAAADSIGLEIEPSMGMRKVALLAQAGIDENWQIETIGLRARSDAATIAAELQLQEIALDLPLSRGSGAEETSTPGSFAIGEVLLKEERIASVSGDVSVGQKTLSFSAGASILDTGLLEAEGSMRMRPGGAEGRVDVSSDPFRIESGQLLARLVPGLDGWDITGEFALNGMLLLAGGELNPKLTLSGRDISALRAGEDESEGIQLRQIAGDVTIDSFEPLSTPLAQRITIGPSRIGGLDMAEASIEFAVEDQRSILIDQAQLNLGDLGLFNALAFRFDPTDPKFQTELYGHDMQLGAWLPLLTDGKATGEGMLYGRLPVRIDPEGGYGFAIGEGFLYAEPGTGTITINDRSWIEENVLDQLESEIDQTRQQVKERILNALTDMEYSMLRCDFIREEDDVMARIVIKGRGRQGPEAQEIGSLTINVWDVNELVSDLLQLKAGLGQ